MNISKRLRTITSFLNKDDIISDIGTDHGLVPIYHCLYNGASKAYALDININPLKQAENNISFYKVNVITKLSNGIENISDDCNTLVIAGMGNVTIESILMTHKEKLTNINKMVIQSNTYSYTIRQLLNTLGYKIQDETVIYDKGKFYEIDCFIKGEETLSSLEIKYGKFNLLKREKDFIDKLKFDLNSKKRIYQSSKRQEVLNEINEIESLIK